MVEGFSSKFLEVESMVNLKGRAQEGLKEGERLGLEVLKHNPICNKEPSLHLGE